MSYDLKFRTVCDHRVLKEEVFLRRNGSSLFIPRPVKDLNSLSLYVNGVLIQENDSIFGYSIETLDQTTLALQNNKQSFYLSRGNVYRLFEQNVDINTIIIHLRDNPSIRYTLDEFDYTLSLDGYFLLFLKEESSIPNNTWLTFDYDYSPLYQETLDKNLNLLKFNKYFESNNLTFEVSYITDIFNCRKCHSYGLVNDFELNSLGSLKILEGNYKLAQDAYIFTFTVKTSDFFYPNLGTRILDYIGKSYESSLTQNSINLEVTQTLNLLRNLQADQYKYQDVTLAETFYDLSSVNVIQDSVDPTLFNVTIEIRTSELDALEIDSTLSTNQVI